MVGQAPPRHIALADPPLPFDHRWDTASGRDGRTTTRSSRRASEGTPDTADTLLGPARCQLTPVPPPARPRATSAQLRTLMKMTDRSERRRGGRHDPPRGCPGDPGRMPHVAGQPVRPGPTGRAGCGDNRGPPPGPLGHSPVSHPRAAGTSRLPAYVCQLGCARPGSEELSRSGRVS